MAEMELAILLRNCPHNAKETGVEIDGNIYERFALKCDSFSVQIAKTPIQVPIPQDTPEIIDIGFYRPSISIGGIIDTIGGKASTVGPWNVQGSSAGYEGGDPHYHFRNMEDITVTRKDDAGTSITATYYIPYKNILEDVVYKWITTADDALELEIGNAEYPLYNTRVEGTSAGGNHTSNVFNQTGGGVYTVAIQQCRFQVDPAQEDRWQFQMQFVCESRRDVSF